MFEFQRLEAVRPDTQPFPHFAAQGLLSPEALAGIAGDFPDIRQPGLFPLSELSYGPQFAALIEDLRRPEFSEAMGRKLGMVLSGKPMMITVRGRCAARDGRSHTDSEDKIATCLLYLNGTDWTEPGGALRLLRSADVDDTIAEIPPLGGTLVAFRRTDNSWHGHRPFEGPRRYIMCNWLRSEAALNKNVGRHKLSAAFKKLDRRHAG